MVNKTQIVNIGPKYSITTNTIDLLINKFNYTKIQSILDIKYTIPELKEMAKSALNQAYYDGTHNRYITKCSILDEDNVEHFFKINSNVCNGFQATYTNDEDGEYLELDYNIEHINSLLFNFINL
jgi:hypothetical protein